MNMPAICNTCGTAFPSGFVFENCRNVSLQGNKSGPCPKCGGMGDIPDGVFDFIDNTIKIISANYKTFEALSKIYNVVREIKNENLTNNEISKRINENIPELSHILSSPSALIYIPIILEALIRLVEFYFNLTSAEITNINTTNNVMNNVTIEKNISIEEIQKIANEAITKAMENTEQAKPSERTKKQKRNELCNCGSGKKYKKCCGNNYI